MGRLYHITKALTEEQKAAILADVRALENVEKADITEEGFVLFTKDGEFEAVMNVAVNIFDRLGAGSEVSFERFVYEA